MNKSKLISVAVLCALALSACVDDKESTSVTALREAKTSYLKAQADYQTAQAEVAKINAEVAKAKTEAEMAIAKLQAEAAVAKTEAETKEIQQRAEQAQKKFEAQLASIEAEAKAKAAQYAADYQEYLNELSTAQRQAVMDKQQDLVDVIEKYKVTLSDIRDAENTISAKTLEIADFNRQKLEALAGNALASAKNAVLSKQAEISGYKVGLKEYQIMHEADAATQKALIEKLREELPAQAEAVKVAKDKYLAANDPIEAVKEQNEALNKTLNGYNRRNEDNTSIHFDGKLDTLGKAWEILNKAEMSIHNRSIFNYIGAPGYYQLSLIQNIKYYSWEVDKLLGDMDKQLTDLKADLKKTDTLEIATNSLKALFVELEKAQAANEKAKQDLDKANEAANNALTAYNKAIDAYNDAVASGDQAKITAAATAKAKAEDAWNKANEEAEKARGVVYGKYVSGVYIPGTREELQNIKNAYEIKRSNNQFLESNISRLKNNIESLEENVELVKAAKEICFGNLIEEIVALNKEIETNNESLLELTEEKNELYVLQQIEESKYNTNKSLVNSWDNASDFLATIEAKINTLQGEIATAEKELENLNDILADPKKLDQEYCELLNNKIKLAEKELATAQDKLSTEKVKAATYKAAIDAWSTEDAK